jgi:hypothetical protein
VAGSKGVYRVYNKTGSDVGRMLTPDWLHSTLYRSTPRAFPFFNNRWQQWDRCPRPTLSNGRNNEKKTGAWDICRKFVNKNRTIPFAVFNIK